MSELRRLDKVCSRRGHVASEDIVCGRRLSFGEIFYCFFPSFPPCPLLTLPYFPSHPPLHPPELPLPHQPIHPCLFLLRVPIPFSSSITSSLSLYISPSHIALLTLYLPIALCVFVKVSFPSSRRHFRAICFHASMTHLSASPACICSHVTRAYA